MNLKKCSKNRDLSFLFEENIDHLPYLIVQTCFWIAFQYKESYLPQVRSFSYEDCIQLSIKHINYFSFF
jgi:hypothetical protein